MERITLKPAKEGRKIPDPKNGQFLPEEGAKILLSKYWRRLLLRGEVVEVKPKPKKTETKPKKNKKIKDEKENYKSDMNKKGVE